MDKNLMLFRGRKGGGWKGGSVGIKGQYNRDSYGDGTAQFPDSGGGYSNTHEKKIIYNWMHTSTQISTSKDQKYE